MQEHSQSCTGRLEVFYNGTWGGVCQSLSAASLRVLCGHLGCGSQGQLLARPRNSSKLETIWLKSIQCRNKHDRSLWQCPSAPWDKHSCTSGEEAWLVCAGELCCGFLRDATNTLGWVWLIWNHPRLQLLPASSQNGSQGEQCVAFSGFVDTL